MMRAQRPVLTSARAHWGDIRRRARSKDEFDRTGALARAVAAVELALTAIDIPRGIGVLDRLRRAGKAPIPGNSRAQPAGVHERLPVEPALHARNESVHGGRVPRPKECKTHVSSLYATWCDLRKRFVNRRNAAALAARFVDTQSITDIFLFGSLARGARTPRDIDLLLMDEGDYSYSLNRYQEVQTFQFEAVLEAAGIATAANRAASQLGWLDLVLLDGSRFGMNRTYTLGLARSQPDPLFFVKISEDLCAFDKSSKLWRKSRPQVFDRLALIRQQLEIEGIVAPNRPRAKARKVGMEAAIKAAAAAFAAHTHSLPTDQPATQNEVPDP